MQNTHIPFLHRTHDKTLANEKIGLGHIPDLIRKKSQSDGFHLNILLVGRRGLGTCTLANALFKLPLIDKNRTDSINIYKNEIYENDILLRTTLTTYHENDVRKIAEYIENMNEEYFDVEQGLSKPIVDPRIHLCIYLIPDDQLRNDEVRMMKELSTKCNFMPVIAKGDCYTPDELIECKQRLNELLEREGINVFVPQLDEDDDEYVEEMRETIDRYPLAVIASTQTHDRNNETVYGRLYQWGFINIESEEVSDFFKLRKLVINNCLDELIYVTDSTFYNEYRKCHMESERVDDALRKNRMEKIRKEMEKILKERNEEKLRKIMNDIEKLEIEYGGKNEFREKETQFGDILNSAQ